MPLRKIILAPDSFKETLSAAEVAHAMADGVRRFSDSIIAMEYPVGDGGEGTMDALVNARDGRFKHIRVVGPVGDAIDARYGLITEGAIAVVELAEASGLAHVPPALRDPTRTTTFGTGQLLADAMDERCSEVILCIGGSATVDGGTGLLQACGFRFFDVDDREITERMCGMLLPRIARVLRPRRDWPRIRVACDVINPLCGPNGAAAVYGPQKGATPEQVLLLDAGLERFATVAGGDAHAPGAGAAGGTGFGLVTFLGAELERGIDLVLETVRFRERCIGADLVMTGEGRLDAQSVQGKACMGVAKAAHELGIPTLAIVGSTGPGAETCLRNGGLIACHSLTDRYGRELAMREAKSLIPELTEEILHRIDK